MKRWVGILVLVVLIGVAIWFAWELGFALAQKNFDKVDNTLDKIAPTSVVTLPEATGTPTLAAVATDAPKTVATTATVSMPVSQVSDMPVAKSETTQGKWEVFFFEGATDQMSTWFSKLKDPEPAIWPDFPNVDNSKANFKAADGLEYGLDESVFMEQNEFGQMPVQARGYRLISGDYNIPGIDACEAADVKGGCAIAIFNVGEVTADLKAWVRQGFTVPGRYWNGDTLELAMWGLSSHVSANMLNMNTNGTGGQTLNQPDRTNAGANCSVVDGCQNVRFVIAVISGNQLLVKAVTTVSK